MECPFLSEGRARYCHAAPLRKLILEGSETLDGRCASPRYRECELVGDETPDADRCPHLEEVRVQYCGASPVTKLVPCSDAQASSCANGNYRYCDSYLARARVRVNVPPPQLWYSTNHFWLDGDGSGLCHIGLDDFLTGVVGDVEEIVFVTVEGPQCPALTLTVHAVEWPMFFPNPIVIQKINHRLRSEPGRLTADPYGAGWLFQGFELPGVTRAGLIAGVDVPAWHASERERLARKIEALSRGVAPSWSGIARRLPRVDLVCLMQQFFTPHAGRSGHAA
jgi:glycine cleavage system H protein